MSAAGLGSGRSRRPELDGARAIAALSVLVFHAVGFWARGSAEGAAIRPWVGRMDVGVAIFFLLSGYLLYRPFVRGRVRLGEYAWRRALRIVPAYWVALTFAAIVLPLHEVWSGIPTFYGFAQIYRGPTAGQGLGQAWTLCVEVTFYAFLPLWALMVARARGAVWPLAILFVASFAYKLLVLALDDPRVGPLEPGLIALPAFLDHFALGMGLAVLEVRGVRLGRAPWAWWAAAAGLFVLAAVGLRDARLDSYTHAEWLARHTLYGLTAVAFLVPVVAGAGGPARVLRAWPLRKLGEISYGVYLYHLVVLALLSRWGLVRWEGPIHPYVLWTGFGLAGSVLLATLSWRLVERPLLRLRPWAGRAGRPAPAPRA